MLLFNPRFFHLNSKHYEFLFTILLWLNQFHVTFRLIVNSIIFLAIMFHSIANLITNLYFLYPLLIYLSDHFLLILVHKFVLLIWYFAFMPSQFLLISSKFILIVSLLQF